MSLQEHIDQAIRNAKRMTAKDAIALSKAHDPAFAVESILASVEKAAKAGKYEIQVRQYGFGDGSCYCNEDKFPPLCQAILKDLRALGYTCSVEAKEMQFVDMWLSVRWAGA